METEAEEDLEEKEEEEDEAEASSQRILERGIRVKVREGRDRERRGLTADKRMNENVSHTAAAAIY